MPRLTQEQELTIVTGFLNENGGEMTHNDLVQALEDNGHRQIAVNLVKYAQGKLIHARVAATGDGRPPVLTYRIDAPTPPVTE